ncbi:MAG: hypothetical protein NTW28_02020 [Candidatus Solibacter sp.]|nr:hypothetical protein [Candidatus Solibacter sp.]
MAANGAKLSSWKEIAAHLGVGLRTAQRWERDRGLPVHRIPGGPRGLVFALPEELDAWRRPVERRPASLRAWWMGAVFLAVAAVPGWYLARPAPRPALVHADPGGIAVSDAQGRALWRWAAPGGLEAGEFQSAEYAARHSFFADVDGDGETETLFAVNPPGVGTRNAELFCFSARGAVKWRFPPGQAVGTRKENFTPMFRIENVRLARGSGGRPLIAVESRHWAFYPAQIAVLDGRGKQLREYWHSGGFLDMEAADLNHDGRDELYLGGTDNGRKMATMLVLDPETMEGAGDQPNDPDYQLLGFPPGREILRVFFPASCISRANAYRPEVLAFAIQGEQAAIRVRHGVDGGGVIYGLSPQGKLLNFSLDDGYPERHAKFEAEGRIRHKFDRAKEEEELRNIEVVRR